MNALEICGICGISVEKKSSAGIYFHADLADFTDILFRCYYVVHECIMLCGREFLFMAVWDDGWMSLLTR
jgi:hypothetical protein